MNFDYHILHAVANGLKYFKENKSAFDKLLPGTSDAYKTKSHTLLTSIEPSFNITSLHKNLGNPAITVYTRSEAMNDMQPMNDRSGSGEYILFQGNTALIYIYADTKEKLRLLTVIVQASMLLFKETFFKVGYDNLRFISSSDTDLNKDGVDNELSSFDILKKEIVYQSLSSITVEPRLIPDEEYPWEITVDLI